MKNKSFPFYLSIIAIYTGIIAPSLFSEGMFTDGTHYATIARNLSVGVGSFWDLQFTETVFPHFHEHPPLAMGLQSIFFDIFGDSLYVERFYSFTTFFITGFLIVMIWRKAVEPEFKRIAWLPLLLWLIIPLNIWAVSNNMLENTMMIFTSFSIFLLMNSLEKRRIIFLFLAGLSLSLAFLTKGFTALFPLGFFLWILLFGKINFKAFITHSFFLLFFFLLPIVILFLFSKEAGESIIAYLNTQVVGSLKNVQTVESRLFIVFRLFKELIPIFALVIIVSVIVWKKRKAIFNKKIEKWSPYIFLAIGLSGVLPIMISMKQSGFYILATFPFFAIFFAMLIAKPVNNWYSSILVSSRGFQVFKTISVLLVILCIGISISQFGKIGRDKDTLKDVYAIIEVVPENSRISILPEMYQDWGLHAYFYRYAYISLDADINQQHSYLLIPNNSEVSNTKYEELPVDLEKFRLFRKRNAIIPADPAKSQQSQGKIQQQPLDVQS